MNRVAYTAEEAAKAHADIVALAKAGTITKRSAAAYKAHVSRRVKG